MRPLYRWSITDGLTRLDLDSDSPPEVPPDASATLAAIKALPERSIVLLLDFHGQLRYAITQRVDSPTKLQGFNLEGYAFEAAASEPDRLVFRRKVSP